MKLSHKNIIKIIIFIIVQSLFVYVDYFFTNQNETMKVKAITFIAIVGLSCLILCARLIFEFFLVMISARISKSDKKLSDVAFDLSLGMPFSIGCFLLGIVVQLFFMRSANFSFQMCILLIGNLSYMLVTEIAFLKNMYKAIVYTYFIYILVYVSIQTYNLLQRGF